MKRNKRLEMKRRDKVISKRKLKKKNYKPLFLRLRRKKKKNKKSKRMRLS